MIDALNHAKQEALQASFLARNASMYSLNINYVVVQNNLYNYFVTSSIVYPVPAAFTVILYVLVRVASSPEVVPV